MTKEITPEQRLNALQEREREILKKLNVAHRAMASETVIAQLQFLLEDCRFQQFELRQLRKTDEKESGFDDYLSIG